MCHSSHLTILKVYVMPNRLLKTKLVIHLKIMIGFLVCLQNIIVLSRKAKYLLGHQYSIIPVVASGINLKQITNKS